MGEMTKYGEGSTYKVMTQLKHNSYVKQTLCQDLILLRKHISRCTGCNLLGESLDSLPLDLTKLSAFRHITYKDTGYLGNRGCLLPLNDDIITIRSKIQKILSGGR